MNKQYPSPQSERRKSERGLSLMEALVAITVFTVVFIVALMLYQIATGSYLRTDSAVIQQQNVRFSMDRMSETLRDAGAGHNMTGSRKLADEQIEGAWESAIFVRGDFDNQRETSLESTTFPIVTVGNDEIVGYVLRKPGANPYTISIKADLTGTDGKRDAIYTSNTNIQFEETVNIDVAARTVAEQTNPPYQLVKVTFEDDGDPKYDVIAENIRSLEFNYLPATGAAEVTIADADSSADTGRDERATIRKIQTKLVGTTDRPDMQKTGADRTFTLEQTILAVNLGVTGRKHNAQPPVALQTPESITACNGHCRNHLIQWEEVDGVSVYRLTITAPAQSPVGAYTNNIDVSALQYEWREPDEDIAAGITRTFTFKVASLSGSTAGTYTSAVTRSSWNDTESRPMAPVNIVAAGAQGENALDITWDAVEQNVNPITDTNRCVSAGSMGGGSAPPMPWAQKAVDLDNSQVFRVRAADGATGADADDDVSTQQIGALQNAISHTAFRDRTAAPCTAYFYRVKACDMCDITSDFSAAMTNPVSFDLPAGVVPAKPPSAPTVVGAVSSNGTNWTVQLQWQPLTAASNGPAATAHYVLERWRKLGAAGTYALDASFDVYESTVGPVDTPPEMVDGEIAYYRYHVKGVYDCSDPRIGALSDPYDLACVPPATHTVAISKPVNDDLFTKPLEDAVPLELTVTDTGWTGASIRIEDPFGNLMYEPTPISGPPDASGKYTFTPWTIPDDIPSIAGQTADFVVKASATVGSCRATAPDVTFSVDESTCGQRIVEAAFQGSTGQPNTSMTFKIENTCPNTVKFNKLKPSWQGVPSGVKISAIKIGTTTIYSGTAVGSGTTINLTAEQSIGAGSILVPVTSGTYTFEFSDNFTSDAGKNGTDGEFFSVTANMTSPTLMSEELVDGAPIP